MKNTRRGFLKTLGKLGAALGIMTTAACLPKMHDHGGHKHPLKANPPTTPKAKPLTDEELKWVKDGRKLMTFTVPDERKQWKYASNVCVTNRASLEATSTRKPNSMLDVGKATEEAQKILDKLNGPSVKEAVNATSRHQEWLNRITMARIDNISMTLKPEVLLEDLVDPRTRAIITDITD